MASPELHLTVADKKLLRLLGQLLTHESRSGMGNQPPNAVVLSDRDATELLALIRAYVDNADFYRSSHFISETTANGGPTDTARELYLTMRKARGRQRTMASYHWSEFQVRLGVSTNRYPYSTTRPLSEEQFAKREYDLFRAAGVSEGVARFAVQMLRAHCPTLGSTGRILQHVSAGDIRRAIVEPFSARRLATGSIPTTKLVAAISLVADLAVLSTTRDWGVVGTLSAIAGSAISLVAE